jgi:hypothetical protein
MNTTFPEALRPFSFRQLFGSLIFKVREAVRSLIFENLRGKYFDTCLKRESSETSPWC